LAGAQHRIPKPKLSIPERLEACEARLQALHPEKQQEAAERILGQSRQIASVASVSALIKLILRASKKAQEAEVRRIEQILEDLK